MKTFIISLVTSIAVLIGFLNIPTSWLADDNLGATITSIGLSDSVRNALYTTTNTNFTNINTELESVVSTTTMPLVTSIPNLATVGTITSGTWTGSAVGPVYGGTGLTSYTTGDIIYASASNTLSKLAIGTNGHGLTISGGVPAWAAITADQTADYTWTGHHIFTSLFGTSASSTYATSTNLWVTSTADFTGATVTGLTETAKTLYSTATANGTGSTASTTLATAVITASEITAGTDVVELKTTFSQTGSSGSCHFDLQFGDGSATTTIGYARLGSANRLATINSTFVATTTTSHITQSYFIEMATGFQLTLDTLNDGTYAAYSTANLASQTYFAVRGRTDGSDTCTMTGFAVKRASQ